MLSLHLITAVLSKDYIHLWNMYFFTLVNSKLYLQMLRLSLSIQKTEPEVQGYPNVSVQMLLALIF